MKYSKKLARGIVAGLAALSAVVGISPAAGIQDSFGTAVVQAAEKNKSARLNQENASIFALVESEYQMTGLAVTEGGRIFVSFPHWGAQPADFSLAEVKDGAINPLLQEVNFASLRRLNYVMTASGPRLFALDEGRADAADEEGKTPRVFSIDISGESPVVEKVYPIKGDSLIAGSLLSDIRVDNITNNAFISDAGAAAILVLDLATGESYRAIDRAPELRKNIQMIYFPNGVYSKLADVCALELSEKHDVLYFSAMGGDIINSVPVKVLLNKKLTSDSRRKAITPETLFGAPCSGMVRRDTWLIMGDLPDEGIWEFDFQDEVSKGGLFDVGIDVKWADSFAIDNVKNLYFTESQQNLEFDRRDTYKLYKVSWGKEGQQRQTAN